MFDRDDVVDTTIERLRRPIEMDPSIDARIMRRLYEPEPRSWATPVAALWRWLREPRDVSITPLGSLAAAVVIGVMVWMALGRLTHQSEMPANASPVQFVILAPHASTVALVGDFNDWDATVTPMHTASRSGMWSVTIPLLAGRHRYAFLVDGHRWLADPSAPPAQDDF